MEEQGAHLEGDGSHDIHSGPLHPVLTNEHSGHTQCNQKDHSHDNAKHCTGGGGGDIGTRKRGGKGQRAPWTLGAACCPIVVAV